MLYQLGIMMISWCYMYSEQCKEWAYRILYDLLRFSCMCEIQLRRALKLIPHSVGFSTSNGASSGTIIDTDVYATFIDSREVLFSKESAPTCLQNVYLRLSPSEVTYSKHPFISLILSFPNDEIESKEYDEDPHAITLELKTDDWNYFIVGNKLNRAFFQFFLTQTNATDTFTPTQWKHFTWMIIDDCANIHSFKAEDEYIIEA